jgi:hypothetical protein
MGKKIPDDWALMQSAAHKRRKTARVLVIVQESVEWALNRAIPLKMRNVSYMLHLTTKRIITSIQVGE